MLKHHLATPKKLFQEKNHYKTFKKSLNTIVNATVQEGFENTSLSVTKKNTKNHIVFETSILKRNMVKLPSTLKNSFKAFQQHKSYLKSPSGNPP